MLPPAPTMAKILCLLPSRIVLIFVHLHVDYTVEIALISLSFLISKLGMLALTPATRSRRHKRFIKDKAGGVCGMTYKCHAF